MASANLMLQRRRMLRACSRISKSLTSTVTFGSTISVLEKRMLKYDRISQSGTESALGPGQSF